ncbi:MAG: DoxX family protein [Chitinophaga sp.]|uniref:DoxX family protein n=1 Tax=Chitinophaga sp. TaxID=1869181 RepID=UPI0025C009D6|nr:DoxX family protein [Chitinophaga sp.]MBV8253192.1 DoxX family protein [Chitinophaga sp.]
MTTFTTARIAKKDRIIYWIFTILFVLMDSVPAIWFNSELARNGIKDMGFPAYFGVELGIGKIVGGLLLILPMIPARFKEWAYVGFGISLISAGIANLVVKGPLFALAPLAGLVILTVSYVYFHRIRKDAAL